MNNYRILFWESGNKWNNILNEIQNKHVKVAYKIGTHPSYNTHVHDLEYNITNINLKDADCQIQPQNYTKYFPKFIEFSERNLFPECQSGYNYRSHYEHWNRFCLIIRFYCQVIKQSKINFILLSRAPHLGSDYLLKVVAKILNIELLYLYMQGPEPHRVFIHSSRKQTNYDADVERIESDHFDFNLKNFHFEKTEFHINSLIKNSHLLKQKSNLKTIPDETYVKQFYPNTLHYGYKYLYHSYELNKIRFELFSSKTYHINKEDIPSKFIHIPLHLQPEAATSLHGGIYSDQILVIEKIRKIAPNNVWLLVKENPQQTFYQRDPTFFQRLKAIPKTIYYNNHIDPTYLLKKATLTASVCGSVGFESLLVGKPCIYFGKIWYEGFHGAIKYTDNIDFNNIVKINVDRNTLISNYIELFEKSFYAIHPDLVKDCSEESDITVSNLLERLFANRKNIQQTHIYEDSITQVIDKRESIVKSKNYDIIAETDWLNTKPIFYNKITKKLSESLYKVVDWNAFDWDWEGLAYYLTAGYCVLGKTPVKNVEFLPANSFLESNGKQLKIKNKEPYDYDKVNNDKLSLEEILFDLENHIKEYIPQNETIILPLSAGYDSRYLLSLIEDRSSLNCFSYGVSEEQYKSVEVVTAKIITDSLKVRWKHIPIVDCLQHCENVYKITEFSSHLHGMYHFEFYTQIQKTLANGTILSGIVGDAWAGSLDFQPIKEAQNYPELFLSHNINVNPSSLVKAWQPATLFDYFNSNQDRLSSPKNRIVEAIGNKMMMLRFLFEVPKTLGFSVSAPFLDRGIAEKMLFLPDSLRKDRRWQKDIFNKLPSMSDPNLNFPKESWTNSLDLQGFRSRPMLLGNCLYEIIKKSDLEKINAMALEIPDYDWKTADLSSSGKYCSAYNAIRVLKPLEFLIQQRDRLCR